MLELRDNYAKLTKYQEAYFHQGKDIQEIDNHRQALNICLKNAPRVSDSLASGGSGGFIPIYLYRIREYVTDGAFRQWCSPHMKAVREALPRYERETRDWIARRDQYGANAPASGEKPRSAAWEPFQVFVAGKDMLVGQISTLKAIPSCQLKGWGRDCEKTVGAAAPSMKAVSPAFEKYEDAIAYYCSKMKGPRKTVMLTGGRDATAEWGDEGVVNVQNGPGCPAAAAPR